jgi:O-antigen/teichoic acid export membrane protein
LPTKRYDCLMNKDFLRSATLLIAVNLLIKPLYIFGIDRTLQNIVGTAEYGIYFALFNYTLFGQVLLDFGINNFNNRAIAQQHHLLTSYLPTFLRLKVLLALAYMGSCFVGAMLLNYNLHQQKLLFWLALSQILASFGAFFRSNLQGLHLFGKDSLVSVTDRLFLIVVVGSLLLLYKGMDILQFAYLQTAAYAITAGVGALFVWQQIKTPLVWRYNSGVFRGIISQTYPYALLMLLMLLYSRIDAVLIEYLLPEPSGAEQAGIYASAYRLLDAANMIAVLLATILLPMFARLLHQQTTELYALAGFSARLMLVGAVALVVPCLFFGNEVMHFLYHQTSHYAVQVFACLMLSFVATSSVYIYGTLLTANGSIWQLNGIALLGMVLNISLNVWLIPQQGALGAAYVALVTQFVVALLHLVVAIRVCKLPIMTVNVFKSVGFVAACVIGTWWLANADWAIWHVRFLAAAVWCMAWAFLLKMIDVRMVWKVLQR